MPMSIETALDEHRALLKRVRELEGEVNASLEREAILKGRIEQLDTELGNLKAENRHNMNWAVEVTKQLHNVGIFVSDALHQARAEINANRGNGRDVQSALNAVEKALGVTHEPVQHESQR